MVSVAIGEGTISDDFSNIDWANGPYFIKTETDPTGGNNYTITGISQLLSVPYALHSKTAANTFSGDYNDLSNTSDLTGPQGANGFDGQGGVTTAGNNVTITGTRTVGDPYVVNATDNIDDADNDPTNELQVLSLSNDALYLSNGGNVYIGNSNLVSQNIVNISSINRDTISCVALGTVIYNNTTNKYEGSILSGILSEALCPNLGGASPYNNYFSSDQTFTTGSTCGYFKEIKMYIETNSFGGTPKCRISLYKGIGNTSTLLYQYDHNSGISHNSWLTTTIPDIFYNPNEVYSIVFENTNGFRVGWYASSCGYSDGTWIDVDGTSYAAYDHAFEVIVQKTTWSPLN